MQLPILGHFHYLGAMYKIVVFINITLTLCHNISKKVIWTFEILFKIFWANSIVL